MLKLPMAFVAAVLKDAVTGVIPTSGTSILTKEVPEFETAFLESQLEAAEPAIGSAQNLLFVPEVLGKPVSGFETVRSFLVPIEQEVAGGMMPFERLTPAAVLQTISGVAQQMETTRADPKTAAPSLQQAGGQLLAPPVLTPQPQADGQPSAQPMHLIPSNASEPLNLIAKKQVIGRGADANELQFSFSGVKPGSKITAESHGFQQTSKLLTSRDAVTSPGRLDASPKSAIVPQFNRVPKQPAIVATHEALPSENRNADDVLTASKVRVHDVLTKSVTGLVSVVREGRHLESLQPALEAHLGTPMTPADAKSAVRSPGPSTELSSGSISVTWPVSKLSIGREDVVMSPQKPAEQVNSGGVVVPQTGVEPIVRNTVVFVSEKATQVAEAEIETKRKLVESHAVAPLLRDMRDPQKTIDDPIATTVSLAPTPMPMAVSAFEKLHAVSGDIATDVGLDAVMDFKAADAKLDVVPVQTNTPTNRPDVARAIAAQLFEVAKLMPDKPVELTLNPEELGRVKLTVTAGENGVMVSVIAERPETLDLMRRNIDILISDFQDLGFENIGFDFGSPDDETGGDGRKKSDGHASDTSEDVADVTAIQLNLDAPTGLDLRL